MIFNKNVKSIITLDFPTQDLRGFSQFYRADPSFVWKFGNPIYRMFLNMCPFSDKFKYISVDSRVHMLMPGWYPCIPGWHCDDFYRPNGQPDLENVPEMNHFAMVIGSTACTEFITKPINLPGPDEILATVVCPKQARPLYAYYNQCMEYSPLTGSRRQVESGEIIQFGPLDFHRGMPATNNSWRLFVRATESDVQEPLNELRTQTQVYLPSPFEGW